MYLLYIYNVTCVFYPFQKRVSLSYKIFGLKKINIYMNDTFYYYFIYYTEISKYLFGFHNNLIYY